VITSEFKIINKMNLIIIWVIITTYITLGSGSGLIGSVLRISTIDYNTKQNTDVCNVDIIRETEQGDVRSVAGLSVKLIEGKNSPIDGDFVSDDGRLDVSIKRKKIKATFEGITKEFTLLRCDAEYLFNSN
jgi:hypothetical protein